ncbi:MAG: glycosyltransferase [Myxococcales bacterium]|nr:glycosyltransferase [Myxococcales bacterium]
MTALSSLPHLVAFDIEVGGHHGVYLLHLAREWGRLELPGRLTYVVSTQFRERHADVVAAASAVGIGLHEVPPVELSTGAYRHLRGPARIAAHAMLEWRRLVSAAATLGATHVIALYLDRLLQVPLATGLRSPCPVSGIYFRPTFHYRHWAKGRISLGDRARAARQEAVATLALRNPSLHTLFTLDAFAAAELQIRGHRSAEGLSDPVDLAPAPPERIAALRARLGLDASHRRLVLLFGVLTSRKGIPRVMKAIAALPLDVVAGCHWALVGPLDKSYRTTLETELAGLAAKRPDATVTLVAEFVPEEDTQAWFELADLVLVPYERHVGMSGILVRAAAAGRPVLADDFGLVGALTRQDGLGLSLDTSSPDAFASALARWFHEPTTIPFSPAGAARFARRNRAPRFARQLLRLCWPDQVAKESAT